MAILEQEKNFGERNGERARNIGLVLAVAGFIPGLHFMIVPALGIAVGGEVVKRVSKSKQPQYTG